MSSARHHQRGFTLLEILLTVAIVTIITSIALPSYQQHVQRSHRTDAMTALLRIANEQEKWYLQNNTYTTSLADLDATETRNNYYVLRIENANQNTFLASAEIRTGGPQVGDDLCQRFTINANGTLGAQGADGDTTAQCWR